MIPRSLAFFMKRLEFPVSNKNFPASVSTTDVSSLEAKVAALEGFVKALQADGYLTLANIKKAAADACPIESSAE